MDEQYELATEEPSAEDELDMEITLWRDADADARWAALREHLRALEHADPENQEE